MNLFGKKNYQARKLLKSKIDVYIIKPDKGAGAINHSDYITKISDILNDISKFEKLVDISLDNTFKMETKIQSRF